MKVHLSGLVRENFINQGHESKRCWRSGQQARPIIFGFQIRIQFSQQVNWSTNSESQIFLDLCIIIIFSFLRTVFEPTRPSTWVHFVTPSPHRELRAKYIWVFLWIISLKVPKLSWLRSFSFLHIWMYRWKAWLASKCPTSSSTRVEFQPAQKEGETCPRWH